MIRCRQRVSSHDSLVRFRGANDNRQLAVIGPRWHWVVLIIPSLLVSASSCGGSGDAGEDRQYPGPDAAVADDGAASGDSSGRDASTDSTGVDSALDAPLEGDASDSSDAGSDAAIDADLPDSGEDAAPGDAGGSEPDSDTDGCAPTVESCDGVDNDCDGFVDDGDPGGGEPCTTLMPGMCSAGTLRCTSGYLNCTQTTAPTAEICDGFDNDCDGQTDEELFSDIYDFIPCDTGELGDCSVGYLRCVSGSVVCHQTGHPSPDVCDGDDNDCDGATDDDDPHVGESCTTGGLGVCSAGTTACIGGAYVCEENEQASAEICDGRDDDCDGQTDDGVVGTGAVCCNTGLLNCNGTNSAACVGGTCANDEVCGNGACHELPFPCGDPMYFEGHVYSLCWSGSWWWAAGTCKDHGGHLATVTSATENDFLRAMATQASADAWISLRRTDPACDWMWATGEALVFTGWGAGQPDGSCGNQDCVQLWSGVGYHWDNMWCSYSRAFICEWEP